MASPDSAFRELSRGMRHFWRSWSLAAVVADDLVDIDNDVLGNLGIYSIAINHLDEGDALFFFKAMKSASTMISASDLSVLITYHWGQAPLIGFVEDLRNKG